MAFSKNSEFLGKGVNITAILPTDIFNWISLEFLPYPTSPPFKNFYITKD